MNRTKYISVFTIAMIALTIIVRYATSLFLTDVSPLFWVVPAYFWLFYIVMILLFDNTNKLINSFMLFKGVKMFMTMVIMFVLAFIFRQYTTELIIYFLVYYMLLLVMESLFLLHIKNKR